MPDRRAIARELGANRSRRLGRPTKARAAAILDTILEAAFQAFVEAGFDAATMEGVAERAGVSKGTLYSRFPAKDSLFKAVLQDRINRWSAVCATDDDRLPTELGPLLRHHARTVQKTLEWPELARIRRLIYGMEQDNFPEIRAFWEEFGTERFVGLLADDMAAAAGEPDGSQPDWPFLARVFLFTFSGWYQSRAAVAPLDPAEITAFIDKLVDAILVIVAAGQG